MADFGRRDAKDINDAVAGGFSAAFGWVPGVAPAIQAGSKVVNSQIIDRFVPPSEKERAQMDAEADAVSLAARRRQVERRELDVREQLAELRRKQLAGVTGTTAAPPPRINVQEQLAKLRAEADAFIKEQQDARVAEELRALRAQVRAAPPAAPRPPIMPPPTAPPAPLPGR